MEAQVVTRRALKWTAWILGIVIALLAVLAAIILIAASHLRGPLIRFAAARAGRPIQVDGALDLHLLSLHPRVVAERVVIANPPWTAPGTFAELGRLTLVYDLPLFGRSFAIRRFETESAKLHLMRDAHGHANWQWTEPEKGGGKGPPLVRSLSMVNTVVELDDALRHLVFNGTVSAQDAGGVSDVPPLRIDGAGQLNGKAAHFVINGDPLATVSRGRPYHFDFSEDSSGSHLNGRGALPHPFDFNLVDAAFEAAGQDMKDLYYLTGVRLPDTGVYRVSGKFAREYTHFTYSDLAATSGQSDVHGTLSIEIASGRPQVEAELNSQLLRLSDLGAQAAGRASEPAEARPLLLPDTAFHLNGLRRSDAVVNYHAQGVAIGRVVLHAVAAKVTINNGLIAAAPLSAALPTGRIGGEIRINVTREVPSADIDLKIANLALSQFGHKVPPPLDGLVQARVTVKGQGRSIHELAANANGKVTAVLPHGAMRDSLAELSGIDFRALGLLAAKDKADTGIRCGVASFQVRDGTLTSQSLVVDTDPVLITGQGSVNLDSEALDFALRGRPKSPRLRVRAPVLIRGTLKHPAVSLEKGKTAVQAGEAVALGVLLTPVAALLAFVDPGLAKDADCAALLAQAGTR